MKIFQSFKKLSKNVGISEPQLFQNHPFNAKNLLATFFLGIYFICALIYLLFVAKAFSEYTESFYTVATTLMCFIHFTSLVVITAQVFDLIKNFESLIEKRKYLTVNMLK